MRKIILMTSAVVLFPISTIAQTTCTASPDCASLGYTESSCPDGNGVKCPWGNKWFCGASCSQLGFTYSCSGTGYSGGQGEACNGKYQSCSCANGLIWSNGACVETCPIGSILFSDFTCDNNLVAGKTPIGVVVYKDGNGGGQAMALNKINNAKTYAWGTVNTDIAGLTNYDSSAKAAKDFASCENSKKIMAAGNSSVYPAVWAANSYATEGTKAGDWCLPAAGIFGSIKNNSSAIENGFSIAGGSGYSNGDIWSSTEYHEEFGWYALIFYSSGMNFGSKASTYAVRPVIEF